MAAPGFTRDEVVEVIANRLGQRTDLNTQIIAELQLAQDEMEGREPLPWFLVASTSLSALATVQTVAVPTTFLRELEDTVENGSLWIPGDSVGSNKRLLKKDLRFLGARYTENAKPVYYALVGDSFLLFPTPDVNYTLTLRYFACDVRLDTNIKNNWLKWAPDLLMARAGLSMARFLRDVGAVQLFQGDLSAASARLTQRIVARAVAATDPRFHGFEDDEDVPDSYIQGW